MAWQSVALVKRLLLLGAAFLLVDSRLPAQGDARGTRSPVYPWKSPDYSGYNEPSYLNLPYYAIPPAGRAALAKKYQLHVVLIPEGNPGEDANRVVVMAHLPENARIWFQNQLMREQGTLRRFVSPSLTAGGWYNYTVRVAWVEDGKWVSQTHNFPVKAGDTHCIDIIPRTSKAVEKEVTANLAKMAPEDRKAAEAQQFCPIQEGVRLGSMGVPVKVTLKGETVFLCCEGCVATARNNADAVLDQVQKLKAKKAAASSP
jgi:uncharacterized protein (TIGR03000 family)